jgi:hypothetical protein
MAAENLAIHSITRKGARLGIQQQWVVETSTSTGVTHGIVFPLYSFEARAAEYGFDWSDQTQLDQVINIVLHELFIPDPTNPDNFFNDAAMAAGITTRAHYAHKHVEVGDKVPVHLYNAPDIDTARDAMLVRLDAVQKNGVRVASSRMMKQSSLRGMAAERGATEDHLNIFRREHNITGDRYAEVADFTSRVRESYLSSVPVEAAPIALPPRNVKEMRGETPQQLPPQDGIENRLQQLQQDQNRR